MTKVALLSGRSLLALTAAVAVATLSLAGCNAPPPPAATTGAAPAETGPLGPDGKPAGSYRDSCKDIAVAGDTLSASCLNLKSESVPSTLDLKTCKNLIGNMDGVLTCGPPA